MPQGIILANLTKSRFLPVQLDHVLKIFGGADLIWSSVFGNQSSRLLILYNLN